ncbi:MAG: hypothetical protein O3A95_06680 [Planctomycetota bacterium]|nr:hypothetical protein [Planctomycetota bacterium]MDA1113967.1 hypothetical protein [Planctomycetota bacterium]
MNQSLFTLFLAVVLLCGVAFYFSVDMSHEDSTASELQMLPEIGIIAERLESMDERMMEMEQRFDSMSDRPVAQSVNRSLDAETINRMIAEALDERGPTMFQDAMGEGANEEMVAAAKEKLLNASIAQLLDPKFQGQGREELWDQLKE